MVEKKRVAVLGAAGYAGGEVLRLVLGHPSLELAIAGSRSHEGKGLEAAHPPLEGLTSVRFTNPDFAQVAREAQVVFLALGHGESIAAVKALEEHAPGKGSFVICDLSGDFRLATGDDYEEAYGKKHDAPDLIPSFVYGLTECVRKDELRGAARISNPGCFATAAALSVAPLADAKLLRGTVVLNGVTGASGSGAQPGPGTHFPVRDGNFKAYKVLSHQHEPEILQTLERLATAGTVGREPARREKPFELVFTAHSAPITRGIHVTATCELEREQDVLGIYRRFFEGSRFVRVRDRAIELKGLAGTNRVELGVTTRKKHVVVTCAIDNLVKGAAGQAVQNVNVALGLPEDEGLRFTGLWP